MKPRIQKEYFSFNETKSVAVDYKTKKAKEVISYENKLDFNAANFKISKKDVGKKQKAYFNYYNTNSDKKLDENELTEIILDLKEADGNEDGNLSNKEINALIKEISGKKKVTKTQRKEFFNFLENIQNNYETTIRNKSDGVIDSAPQGGMGDCWFLTNAISLSTTEWGREAIKDAITDDKKNKRYKVNLDGVDFETTFSYKEVEAAKKATRTKKGQTLKYSLGDVDMLLLELAAEKYIQKEMDENGLQRKKPEEPLTNGYTAGKLSLHYMLTGRMGHIFMFSKSSTEKLKDTSKLSEWQKCSWKNIQDCVSNAVTDKKEAMTNLLKEAAKDMDNYSIGCGRKEMGITHEYAIKDISFNDDGSIKEVGCTNPWSPDEIKWFSFDDYVKTVVTIDITSKDDTYEQFMEGFEPHPRRIED